MIKSCVIGLSKVGIIHCESLLKIKNTSLNYIFDKNYSLSRRLAKKFKCKLIITIHTTPCRCLGNATFYNDPKLSGKFNDRLCSANHLYEKGIPKPLAFLISHQKMVFVKDAQHPYHQHGGSIAPRSLIFDPIAKEAVSQKTHI